MEIDATALELELRLSAAVELELNAAAEEDGLMLDAPVPEAEGVVLVGAKFAADEVAATGELTDDIVGEAASDGVEDGVGKAGAFGPARAGTAAPARTRRWLSFMSK